MYRVLVVILLAYAVCFPRLASHSQTGLAAAQRAPSRAELMLADLKAWLAPISPNFATLQKPQG